MKMWMEKMEKKELSTKIVEFNKEINEIHQKIKEVKEAWIRALEEQEEQDKLAGKKMEEEDEGKKKKNQKLGKMENNRRRRIKRRVRPRRDHYGDWRPIPKPQYDEPIKSKSLFFHIHNDI